MFDMAQEILPAKKVCLLCDNPLSGECGIRRKSREDVFPSWVLEKFNLENKPIRFSRLEAMQDERSLHISQQREFRAFDLDSFLLGSVCEHCNNGWMSRLEDLTKPALSDLIAEQHAAAAPGLALAKWVLKTAYVLSAYLDPPIGRIPRSHGLSLVGDQLQLPKGVAVFHRQTSEFRVWFSICPTFIVEDSDKDAMIRRYKASYKYVL
jgi:hypothetical protein